MSTILLSIFGVAFAFGLVIFVHEFGHFIVAKRSGVKVERFSFGLGPEMVGFQWGETRYCVAWLPLGGEVRMAGEAFESPSVTPAGPGELATDRSREFFAQPWYLRILIAFAGPFMNYVLAALIFFVMLAFWGEPVQTNKTQVGEVMGGMPADLAGLKPGDKIESVQGQVVEDFADLASKIRERPAMDTEFRILRGQLPMSVHVVPLDEHGVGLVGIRPADPVNDYHKIGLADAAEKSVVQCWTITAVTLYYLEQKIRNHNLSGADVSGPIGISRVIAKAVKSGPEDFFYLIGLISVSIGLFNLFPIPLLDGGHVMYYLIEGVWGRPLNQKVMARVNMVGLALLLSLLAFATMNDIQHLRGAHRDSTAGPKAP